MAGPRATGALLLALTCLCASADYYDDYDDNIDDETLRVALEKSTWGGLPRLFCRNNDTWESLPPMNDTMANSKPLEVINCPTPSESYAAALESYAAALESYAAALESYAAALESYAAALESYAAALESLKFKSAGLTKLYLKLHIKSNIYKTVELEPLSASHLTGLSITSLKIFYDPLQTMDLNILKPIVTLQELSLHYATLEYSNSSSRGCTKLERLSMRSSEVPESSVGQLARCGRLSALRLRTMSADSVRRALAGLRTLRYLSVTYCGLVHLDDLLEDSVELRKLDLSHNGLTEINRHHKSLQKLEELNLSYNNLKHMMPLWNGLQPLKQMRRLSIDKNPELNLCNIFLTMSDNNLPVLELFSIRGIGVRHNGSLLDLDNYCNADPDFKHLSVDDWREILRRNMTVVVDWSLDCDCHNGNFARALSVRPGLRLRGARCDGGGELPTAPLDALQCERFACGPCACRRPARANARADTRADARADCRAAELRAVPRLAGAGATALLARDNRIDNLRADDFPDTLSLVDLRDNKLSRVDAAATAALFARDRRVLLAGNPLVCDCDNRELLEALRDHRMQIEDYENLICFNDGRVLSDVDPDELCADPSSRVASRPAWLVAALLGTSGVALAVCGAALWCRFERHIKVFLFARGCCLACLREDWIEPEREYDAFVSFCHQDDEFVNEHILPGLRGYKLCINYRDWIAGEWISTQITRSIEQSRRTIIVLSRNFLSSMWGMHEFRMAHAKTMQERRPRLVVVVVGDVLADPLLDAELRGYMATNTYVRWGERWFWSKLRFALPHRPRASETDGDAGSRTELQEILK